MNWYLETELRHSIVKWDIIREGFLMPFSFEDGLERTDKAVQKVKETTFKIPQDPLELIQSYWSTQPCHALECYIVNAEGDDEVPRNINIPEA